MRELFQGFIIGSIAVLGVFFVLKGAIYMVHLSNGDNGIFLSDDEQASLVCGSAIVINESGADSNQDLRERFEWALEHRFDCPE